MQEKCFEEDVMLRKIAHLLKTAWRKYSDFVRENGLDEGNCRRCVPIIRHDPPLARKNGKDTENSEDTLEA